MFPIKCNDLIRRTFTRMAATHGDRRNSVKPLGTQSRLAAYLQGSATPNRVNTIPLPTSLTRDTPLHIPGYNYVLFAKADLSNSSSLAAVRMVSSDIKK